jgi:hypothetical protein
VTQLYPRALGSHFVTSYDSQGYGGGNSNPPPHGLDWLLTYYPVYISARTTKKTPLLRCCSQLLPCKRACLRSSYSVTAVVYLLILRSLHSKRVFMPQYLICYPHRTIWQELAAMYRNVLFPYRRKKDRTEPLEEKEKKRGNARLVYLQLSVLSLTSHSRWSAAAQLHVEIAFRLSVDGWRHTGSSWVLPSLNVL